MRRSIRSLSEMHIALIYVKGVQKQVLILAKTFFNGRKQKNCSQAAYVSSATQELQCEINELLLEDMHDIEFDDWGRFGKVRQAEEKRLRDPNDVFIHAEERRQELSKNGKKQLRPRPNY